jgi:hypothetical protein
MERLPDFLIIGAMKAGTTTLYHDLRAVEGVFLPFEKEPACLIDPKVLSEIGRSRYARHYRACADSERAGDASTDYSKLPDHPGVPERARSLLGSAVDVIYMVRDPIKRLISQHGHDYGRGRMPRDINEALRTHECLISYSRYRTQLEPWIAEFGRDRVCVVSFERYVSNRRIVLGEILAFLGICSPLDHLRVEDAYNAASPRIPAGGLLDKLVSSQAYRLYVRPHIPTRLRGAASMFGSVKMPIPTQLSSESEQHLLDVFRSDVEWLDSFGIEMPSKYSKRSG